MLQRLKLHQAKFYQVELLSEVSKSWTIINFEYDFHLGSTE